MNFYVGFSFNFDGIVVFLPYLSYWILFRCHQITKVAIFLCWVLGISCNFNGTAVFLAHLSYCVLFGAIKLLKIVILSA